LEKIYRETRDDKLILDISYIEKVKGYKKSDTWNWQWDNGYEFSNNDGCQCFIYFKGKQKRIIISMKIDGISTSSGWYGTIGTLYRCMDEINDIAKEFRQLRSNLEKQEKIDKIAKNSINTWLKEILQNQPYSYCITESENKITLAVKMRNRLQLDIPIYYKSFQIIMPELLNVIQQYEKIVNEGKIKVLITNTLPNQQWNTVDK
jgi:hypothetical protein